MEPEKVEAAAEETVAEVHSEIAVEEAAAESTELGQQEYTPVRRERRAPPKKKHPVLGILGILLVFLAGIFCGYRLSGVNAALNVTLTVEDRTAETDPETRSESGKETQEEASTGTADETTDETVQEPVELPWNLVLVNPWNAIAEDLSVELKELLNGQMVDDRCYEDLSRMLSDCRAAGLGPVVCSAYRSLDVQTTLFENKVSYYMNQGMSQQEAEETAATIVAVPGTSEHHLGLAVDIVDELYQQLDEAQEETAVQKWLMEHCWEYGFILRYPNGSTDITGIIYEPWHYRYVGAEAAKEIHELDITLEEYLELKYPQE